MKNQRIPNNYIYNLILTLVLALGVVWVFYSLTPYSHYSLYLIESKNKLSNNKIIDKK